MNAAFSREAIAGTQEPSNNRGIQMTTRLRSPVFLLAGNCRIAVVTDSAIGRAVLLSTKELAAILASMLENIPGVVVGEKFNATNFTIRDKVFAFTKDGGMVLKLPPETVKELIKSRTASLLVMGKRTMKEWVVIRYKNPTDARKHLALFQQAIDYVSSAGR
jgi:hypothetical protein